MFPLLYTFIFLTIVIVIQIVTNHVVNVQHRVSGSHVLRSVALHSDEVGVDTSVDVEVVEVDGSVEVVADFVSVRRVSLNVENFRHCLVFRP